MKNKIILTGLFLTGAVSCASFKPFVLTDAYLFPESVVANTTYDDLNWAYALFNQYASGLTYKFRLTYSNSLSAADRNASIIYVDSTGSFFFTDFTTITSTFAEGELNAIWKSRLNKVLFDRDFDRTSKFPALNQYFIFRKFGVNENTAFSIVIDSSISYQVNIGSAYIGYLTNSNAGISNLEQYLSFYNKNDDLLQTYLLEVNPPSGSSHNLYNFSTITTNVNRFVFEIFWIDIPPYVVAPDNFYIIKEFALFTQGQEIVLPDDTSGDRFGLKFVAVEWWNILGQLQNFVWWIVNQSPIAPIFEWIDEYVITWISGLITFITGVFRL